MYRIGQFCAALWRDESGISSVEYALLLAFVGTAIIVGAQALSGAVSNEMDCTANTISTANNAC